MHNLEAFWRAYEAFESTGVNKDLVRGLLAENQPRYTAALAEFRARKNRRDGINQNALASPPRGRPKENEQARLWRRFVGAERLNPHNVEPEELQRRVSYAYQVSMSFLYRYPDAWLDLAYFHLDSGHPGVARETFRRGLEAVPGCPLLYFAFADFEELQGNTADAVRLYEELLEKSPTSLAYIQYMRFVRRSGDVEKSRKVFLRARRDPKYSTFHVYIAAARIELYLNKEANLAKNIFELGMRQFPDCVGLALEFITFLWNMNDERYLRVVFNRVLDQLPKVCFLSEPSRQVNEYSDLFCRVFYSSNAKLGHCGTSLWSLKTCTGTLRA